MNLNNLLCKRNVFLRYASITFCFYLPWITYACAEDSIVQAVYSVNSEKIQRDNDVKTSLEQSNIVQTSGKVIKTNEVSKSEAALGKSKSKQSGSAAKLVDELENLPNLNVRADDETQVEHKPHGAKLSGVMPGGTTFSELKSNPTFSKPVAEEDVDGYHIATFQDPTLPDTTIQIVGMNDVVEAIMINLSEPRSESDARKVFESEIEDARPIWAPDEIGNYREVFPEKGIAFVLEAGSEPGVPSNRVVQIVAETVKPEYFIMRAERDLMTSYTFARDDAEHALLHDPNAPGAHWILAQTHLAVGDYTNARKHIFKAIKLNDSLPQFHLTYIDVLINCGEEESALRYLDAVRDTFAEHPLFQIEGVVLDSIMRNQRLDPDFDGSIAQGQRALKMLQTLYSATPNPSVIYSAKKLELRANLSIALAVARKTWKEPTDQEKAFEWLDAASSVAREIDASRPADSQIPSSMIDVYQTALNIALEMPDSDKIGNYADNLRAIVDVYLRKTTDEVSAAAVRWRAGLGFLDAARVYEARKEFKQATIYGAKAVEYLDIVTQYRPANERIQSLLANLQLGILLSNGLKKDDEAFEYLDKAMETLNNAEKEMTSRDASSVGTPLATVASIYWKKGQKNEAVEIMKKAVTLLEKGLENGYVNEGSLYVPYANLSTMCKGMKNSAEATKYKKLAEKYAPQDK